MPATRASKNPEDANRGDPAEMMEKMKRLTRGLLAVPKEEIARRVAERTQRRGKKAPLSAT